MQVKQVFSAYDWKESRDLDDFKYCPSCGAPWTLGVEGGRQRPKCLHCGFVHYRNPAPGVAVLVEREGHVLLVRRAGALAGGKWCLPCAYVEYHEDFLTAAIREVKEEAGLDVEIRSILSVASIYLSSESHLLGIYLLARIVNGEPRAGDDLDAVGWFALPGPLPEMAFECDQHIIERYAGTKFEGLAVDPRFASPE